MKIIKTVYLMESTLSVSSEKKTILEFHLDENDFGEFELIAFGDIDLGAISQEKYALDLKTKTKQKIIKLNGKKFYRTYQSENDYNKYIEKFKNIGFKEIPENNWE